MLDTLMWAGLVIAFIGIVIGVVAAVFALIAY